MWIVENEGGERREQRTRIGDAGAHAPCVVNNNNRLRRVFLCMRRATTLPNSFVRWEVYNNRWKRKTSKSPLRVIWGRHLFWGGNSCLFIMCIISSRPELLCVVELGFLICMQLRAYLVRYKSRSVLSHGMVIMQRVNIITQAKIERRNKSHKKKFKKW